MLKNNAPAEEAAREGMGVGGYTTSSSHQKLFATKISRPHIQDKDTKSENSSAIPRSHTRELR